MKNLYSEQVPDWKNSCSVAQTKYGVLLIIIK